MSKNIWLWIAIAILIVTIIVLIVVRVRENLLPYDPKLDELKETLALVHPATR